MDLDRLLSRLLSKLTVFKEFIILKIQLNFSPIIYKNKIEEGIRKEWRYLVYIVLINDEEIKMAYTGTLYQNIDPNLDN